MKYLTLSRYQLEKTSGGNISSLHQLKFGTSNPCIVKSDYSINLPNKFVVWRIILLTILPQGPKKGVYNTQANSETLDYKDYFSLTFYNGYKPPQWLQQLQPRLLL
ncbi:hypothetical protein V6Z11_D09G038200 [Gossypium hirsutum]